MLELIYFFRTSEVLQPHSNERRIDQFTISYSYYPSATNTD
jgi:hypothetical protein